ncbi:hypothetical protein OOZ63_28830, partial [Paucibacter sp. PLA-PC-4]|uniref:hypothetical protein n=1 Tax=Paucibacter sp. PLA-PC-4 TaxID=2993655 RepID=UPI00224B2F46
MPNEFAVRFKGLIAQRMCFNTRTDFSDDACQFTRRTQFNNDIEFLAGMAGHAMSLLTCELSGRRSRPMERPVKALTERPIRAHSAATKQSLNWLVDVT